MKPTSGNYFWIGGAFGRMKTTRHAVVFYSRTAAVEAQLGLMSFWGCCGVRKIHYFVALFRKPECLLFRGLTGKKSRVGLRFKPVFLYRNAINHILSQDSVHPNKSCLWSEHGLSVNVWAGLGFAPGSPDFVYSMTDSKPAGFIAPISFKTRIINNKSAVNATSTAPITNFINIEAVMSKRFNVRVWPKKWPTRKSSTHVPV